MSTAIIIQLSGGALGAIFGQIIQYIHIQRLNEKYDYRNGLLGVIIGSIITFAYFSYIEGMLTVPWVQLIGYGFFISMVIEEGKDAYKKETSGTGQVALGKCFILPLQQEGAEFTLNNGWAVFGTGMLGASMAEFAVLYRQRDKLVNRKTWRRWEYWLFTIPMILIGGVVTLYSCGVDNVSGLLALQLGAGAQFGIERFRGSGSNS